MKHNSQYKYSEMQLPSNDLYVYHSQFIIETFSEWTEESDIYFTPIKSILLDKDKKKGLVFNTSLFVQFYPLENDIEVENISKESINKLNIGQFDKDILDFLKSKYMKNLMVIGNVGRGKTTNTLRFFNYIIPNIENLRNTIFPIYLNLNTFKENIKIIDDSKNQIKYFKNQIFQTLQSRTGSICSIDNEEFWSFIKEQEEYTNLKIYENNIKILYYNAKELKEKLYEKRLDLLLDENLAFYAIKYLKVQQDIQTVIILDNIDQVSTNILHELFDFINAFSNKYFIKTITCIRPSTHLLLQKVSISEFLITVQTRFLGENPQIDKYLSKRFDYLINLFESKEEIIIAMENMVVSLDSNQLAWIYKEILRTLLDDKVLDFISSIANSNLRLLNRLIRIILSSGYLEYDIKELLFGKAETSYKIKTYNIYKSIITNNYTTFFSESNIYGYSILNILYTDNILGQSTSLNYLIQLQICSYSLRKSTFTSSQLYSDFLKVFSHYNNDITKDDINRILAKLINYELLSTPSFYKIEEIDSISSDLILESTNKCKYYMQKLVFNLDYLSFMIDDIDFKSYKTIIKSSIETQHFTERVLQLSKYVQFLFEKELELFETLRNQNNLKIYLEYFSSNSSELFYAKEIMKVIYNFIKITCNKESMIMEKIEDDIIKMEQLLLKY